MQVLITGATGFLGTVLVDRLLAAGLRPVALVRASSRTDELEARGVACRTASLHPAEGLDEALRGIDAVVHAAGGGHVRSVQAFYDNNTETTRNLLEAALRVRPGLARFVLVSSLAAHGPTADGPAPRAGEGSPITHYGRSKQAAERLVLEAAGRLPVTIARPPSIYGPGDWRMLPLFRAAARGWVPIPAPARSTSMLHVRDCVDALFAMLTVEHPTGRTYFVEDGTPRATDELARMIGASVGRRPRVVRVPGLVLRVLGAVSEGLARLRDRPALLTRDKVRDLLQPHWICDAAPLREELGWAPRVAFEEGAAETAAWYRAEGLL